MADFDSDHLHFSQLVDCLVTSFGNGSEHTHELRYFPNRTGHKWRLRSKLGAMGWQEHYESEEDARAGAARWDVRFAPEA